MSKPKFKVTNEGLFYHSGIGEPDRICDSITVRKRIRDASDGFVYLLIEFKTSAGRRTKMLPLGELQRPPQLMRLLAEKGFASPTRLQDMELLAEFLRERAKRRECIGVHTTGHHGDEFVTAHGTIVPGNRKAPRHVLMTGNPRAFPEITDEDLQPSIDFAKWHGRRSYLHIFTSGLALAGALARDHSGSNNAIVHLHGPSGIGKTKLLRAAESIWRNPEQGRPGTWASFAEAEGAVIRGTRNQVLILDGLSGLGPDPKSQYRRSRAKALKFASGGPWEEKSRSTHGSRIPSHGFGLSAGVKSTADLAAGAGAKRGDEELSCLIDLPFEACNRDPLQESAELDQTVFHPEFDEILKRAAGLLGAAFVQRIFKDPEKAKSLAQYYAQKFRERNGVAEWSWEAKLIGPFAAAYAAAMIAVILGILPWKKKRVREAITHCYRRALLEAKDEGGPSAKALQAVLDLIHSPDCLAVPQQAPPPPATEVKRSPAITFEGADGREYAAIRRKEFTQAVGSAGDVQRFLDWLSVQNVYKRPEGYPRTKTEQPSVPGLGRIDRRILLDLAALREVAASFWRSDYEQS